MTSDNPSYTPPVPPQQYGRRDSSLAIISLVAGLVGWTIVPFIGSIVAVITGHLAKKEIRESGGTMSGDGMALAGLILGYTMIGLAILVAVLLVVALLVFIPVVGKTTSGMMGGFLPFLP